MAKPFSIQAPEDIAKEYAGNKQKIAQAAQMGIVDPTAAVLAGMFIDRMRSAQVMEAAQQPTVAQQVLGGGGLPTPAGPGAMATLTPPSPPMQAPMGAPPAPPMEAPMSMADGGLASLPVPDTMFDEPTNGGFDDGYAGGGLVAFAQGDTVIENPADMGAYIEQVVRGLYPDIRIAGRGRTEARNAEVGGVPGSYHLLDAARDISVPPGMSKADFISQLKSAYGPGYDVLPSGGNSVHVEPGPALGKQVRAGSPFKLGTQSAPTSTALPTNFSALGGVSLADMFAKEYEAGEKFFDTKMPAPKREARDKLLTYIKEQGSEEALKKQAREDKWGAIAELGFRMASSNSPYFLQAVGQAASATLPGTKEAKKAREERKLQALQAYADAEGLDNQAAKERVKFAMDFATAKLGYKEKDLTRATDIAKTIFEEEAATQRTRIEQAGANTRATFEGAGTGKGPGIQSSAQLTQLSGQFNTNIKESLEAMRAAENKGDYGQFQQAALMYKNALAGYNDVMAKLGYPGKTSVPLSKFPKMQEEYRRRKPAPSKGERAKTNAGKPPAGVTQAEWNAMSEKDRALFQ